MQLIPLPAFDDNYIWILHDTARAIVVDPGDAQPVLSWLEAQGLTLAGIFVTHHHADHTHGVQALMDVYACPVFGPRTERLPFEPHRRVGQGDAIELLGIAWRVLDVPGHTAGHVAYVADRVVCSSSSTATPLLFCGDTLFSGGCGRLFEGTPAQMLASLDQLAALPANTLVCCTHEYTLSNLRFAREVDPGNTDLQHYQSDCIRTRAEGSPTLPSTVGLERRINPFLRCRDPALAQHIQTIRQCQPDTLSCFAALREWKNHYR
jgi:hydroxyacylglutathione hydrolase